MENKMKQLLIVLVFLSGCASFGSKEVSVTCGSIVTAKLIALHTPWAIVPAIFTIGQATDKIGSDAGSATIDCGGVISVFF